MTEYLDKQKLLMALNDKYHDMSAMPASYYAGFQYAIKLIERLHVGEEVAPVGHAKWEPGNCICPVCGNNKFKGLDAEIWADWTPPFCPNWGAATDLEETAQ